MSFKIFHQLGYRYNWNYESYSGDQTGDGFIIAPRYMKKEFVEELPVNLKNISIFDPQFFLPDTVKGQIESYDFFPEIASSGFDTDEFSIEFADEVAEKCVEFQLTNEMSQVVIPTRFFEGTPSDFIDKQHEFSVDPFMKALKKNKTSKKVTLQLVLNDLMFKDSDYCADLLNWITSLKEINSIYLITQINSTSKQIKDVDFLIALFDFLDSLKSNELELILGYLNTEAIILSLLNPDIMTFGSYENLRSFSLRNFMNLEETRQLAPNPRLYVSRLLQWIEHPYIGAIKRIEPDHKKLFDINKYQAEMFEPSFNWHFNRPQLYKHYFMVFYEQLKYISGVPDSERFGYISELIENAIANYTDLNNKGIVFDYNSDGSHLALWLTVINIFAAKKGWK